MFKSFLIKVDSTLTGWFIWLFIGSFHWGVFSKRNLKPKAARPKKQVWFLISPPEVLPRSGSRRWWSWWPSKKKKDKEEEKEEPKVVKKKGEPQEELVEKKKKTEGKQISNELIISQENNLIFFPRKKFFLKMNPDVSKMISHPQEKQMFKF